MAATTPLHGDTAGISFVAAQLGAAAQGLTRVAADPLIHPPLAADETSGSVAARLSEHGAVVASRAVDGAAVLESAAAAIAQAATAYAALDTANQAVVALRGNPSTPTPATTTAPTTNATLPDLLMIAPPPRPGLVTAQILDAGQPDAGSAFVAACQTVATEFRNCGSTAHAAGAQITAHLGGQAGPQIAAALRRFGDWAHTMANHADTLDQWARQHRARFAQTQQAAPKPVEFTNTHRQLRFATAQFASHPGPSTAEALARAHTALASLEAHTSAVAAGYHIGEIPAAPPGPPPVVPVVVPSDPHANPPSPTPQSGLDRVASAGDGGTGDELTEIGGDILDEQEGFLNDPESLVIGQGLPMASALPSMLTGALGGIVGAATSLPQALGQNVQGFAAQAMQGIGGLTTALTDADEDLGDMDGLSPDGGAGMIGGGGGGETVPSAAGMPKLPPASGGMLAMSAPASLPPMAGLTGSSAAGMPTAATGIGGVPMMMPMGGGMGAAGGTRAVKEPDKKIELPPRPNTAPVKGEVLRTRTAHADGAPKTLPKPASPAKAVPRRIEIPRERERP